MKDPFNRHPQPPEHHAALRPVQKACEQVLRALAHSRSLATSEDIGRLHTACRAFADAIAEACPRNADKYEATLRVRLAYHWGCQTLVNTGAPSPRDRAAGYAMEAMMLADASVALHEPGDDTDLAP